MNIADLQQEYLDKELPYKLNVLMSHYIIVERQKMTAPCADVYKDAIVLIGAFEASILFGRVLLQFLGISMAAKNRAFIRFNKKGNDLILTDIFPNKQLCDLNDPILFSKGDSIKTLIDFSNKKVAHTTNSDLSSDGHAFLPDAQMAIFDLVLKYIPEIETNNLALYRRNVIINSIHPGGSFD